MPRASTEGQTIADGSFDWSGGVDSSVVTTLQSTLNPNGLGRNQLAWLNNATVHGGGINQRTGWQPRARILDGGYWQGGFMYEPDGANPYIVCQIGGVPYQILCEPPFTVTDLSGGDPALRNPSDPAVAEMAWFVQGENFLVIQAGDFYNPLVGRPNTDSNGRTLPLFWNGVSLRRSIGITTPSAPNMAPGVNEIPAATCMDYYGNRLWYAQARSYSAGDIAGGPSGTPTYHFRDAILNVTENPLCFGGDGFSVPVSAGIVRALKHSANINASLGQGQFYIFTRKGVFSLTVPTTRTDWINAGTANMPEQVVVQLVNGAVGDRCIVPINGDLYYQSFDPAIRSLIRAIQYFQQPGNTAISQNEQRILDLNDRGLMRFSSGIEFNQRMLQCVLPQVGPDGLNIVHRAILPLNFDVVTNFAGTKSPVWEGAWDGLNVVQVFEGDFGGLPRAFAVVVSDKDGSLNLWELTSDSRTENGDNRVVWSPEFPAFTWAAAGHERELKQLNGGELWVDNVSGTVDMDVYYRVDAEPCWRHWFHTQLCAKRCQDEVFFSSAYPCEPYRTGYRFPVTFPEPQSGLCDDIHVRPPTIGYQFQLKIMLKGWCRIRGLMLHALPKTKPPFQGIACPTNVPRGTLELPSPFTPQPVTPPAPLPACSIDDLDQPGGPPQFGVAFTAVVSALGGSGSFGYAVVAGALPGGLAMDTAGNITGTPSAEGDFTFTVRATDSVLFVTCSRQFTLSVHIPPCSINALSGELLGPPQIGVNYVAQISASGGSGHFTFAVIAGALPDGLAMNADGEISGIPTTAGDFTFTVTSTDTFYPITCHRDFTLSVPVPPTNPPTHVTGYKIDNWGVVRTQLTDSGCAGSGNPAWNGTFDYTINLSTGDPVYLFLSQSIAPDAGAAQKYSADDKANYPLDNWQDDADYTLLMWDSGATEWLLFIQCTGAGALTWIGIGPNTPGDPTGTYNLVRPPSVSAAPLTISIVSA